MPSKEEDIEGNALRVYLYMVNTASPVGPRDVMRGANLSSPSVAYRQLQRLLDLELIEKDVHGNYIIKEKTSPSGFLWIGRTLISRLLLYSFFFIGILGVEVAIAIIRPMADQPIDNQLLFLILITTVAAALFMFEGYQLKRRLVEA